MRLAFDSLSFRFSLRLYLLKSSPIAHQALETLRQAI